MSCFTITASNAAVLRLLTQIFMLFYLISRYTQYACFAIAMHLVTAFLKNSSSQGNVKMQLRCGGIFNDQFTANFLLRVPVNNFEINQCLKTRTRVQWLGLLLLFSSSSSAAATATITATTQPLLSVFI